MTRIYSVKGVSIVSAMGSESAKEQFLTQLEAILESLRQTVAKAEKRRLNEKLKRDQLNDKYMELLEKQRFYSKLIKEFQQVYSKTDFDSALFVVVFLHGIQMAEPRAVCCGFLGCCTVSSAKDFPKFRLRLFFC